MRKPKQRQFYPAVKPYLSQFYKRRIYWPREHRREYVDRKLRREVRPTAAEFIAAGYKMLEGRHPYEILDDRMRRSNWERPRQFEGPEIELDVLVSLGSRYEAIDPANPPRRLPLSRSTYPVKLYYRFDLGSRAPRWVFVRSHYPEELYQIDREAEQCDELVIAEAREQLECMTIHGSTFQVTIPRPMPRRLVTRAEAMMPNPADFVRRRDCLFIRCSTYEGRAGWRFSHFV